MPPKQQTLGLVSFVGPIPPLAWYLFISPSDRWPRFFTGNSSESDDHFSDAQSAPPSATSPIPRTRVEKVSDEPSYGEVPGTEAYRMREGDAEPDEIAVIPDEVEKEKQRIRAASIVRPSAPGGQPIPKTVLEEAEDVPGRPHQSPVKRHRADSRPDLIVRTDGSVETGESSEAGGNGTA